MPVFALARARKNRTNGVKKESGLCYFTTGFTENTGNARIVSNHQIRDFIRDIRETRGKYMFLV